MHNYGKPASFLFREQPTCTMRRKERTGTLENRNAMNIADGTMEYMQRPMPANKPSGTVENQRPRNIAINSKRITMSNVAENPVSKAPRKTIAEIS